MTEFSGRVESIYCGSGVDGKGLRVVVFFGGCNLRCPFCHNPETLYKLAPETTSGAVVERCLRYRGYFRRGGVTLSGGEPFIQPEFCADILRRLKNEGIHVAVETNGHVVDREIIRLADEIVVDVKNQADDFFDRYDRFLTACDELGTAVTLTCVIVPTVNDDEKRLAPLAALAREHKCVGRVKPLPFRKLCVQKYAELGLDFPYDSYREATDEDVEKVRRIISAAGN